MKNEPLRPPNLAGFRFSVERGIDKLKNNLREINKGEQPRDPEDFNLRGDLYRLALKIAPHARTTDLIHIFSMMRPVPGEVSVEAASGTGFLTLPLARRTKAPVYAFDTSAVQINALRENARGLPVVAIEGAFSDEQAVTKLPSEVVNDVAIVTSFAGIHHMVRPGEQRQLFENADRVLKPGGRFVAADVSADTDLASHFDESVKTHCLTGHKEVWLSPQRIREELTPGTGLHVVSADVKENHHMVFDSVAQMGLWAKALNAYDLPEEQIIYDLKDKLGVTDNTQKGGKVLLNWPLLFFELHKEEITSHDIV